MFSIFDTNSIKGRTNLFDIYMSVYVVEIIAAYILSIQTIVIYSYSISTNLRPVVCLSATFREKRYYLGPLLR